MTDTPRTDAAATISICSGVEMVRPGFARELERENARLREALSWYRDNIDHTGMVDIAGEALRDTEANIAALRAQNGLEPAIKPTHEAADAFWNYWRANGETHKHGYYELTWGAINAALLTSGVVWHNYGKPQQDASGQNEGAEPLPNGQARKIPEPVPPAPDDMEKL